MSLTFGLRRLAARRCLSRRAGAARRSARLQFERLEDRLALATISGTVFLDANRNGVRDGAEQGLMGVSVGWSGAFDNSNSGNAPSGATGQYALADVVDATGNIASIQAVAGANREVTSPTRVAAAAGSVDLAAGTRPTWVAAGRLNGDATVDIVAANTGSTFLSLFFNQNGLPYVTATVNVGTQASVVLVEDFNKDGANDIAVGYKGSAFVTLLINDGSGGFGTRIDLPTPAATPTLDAADIDGDQDLDLVGLTSGVGPQILAWRNDSSGAASFTALAPSTARANSAMVVTAKLDPTGPADLLVIDALTNEIVRYSNSGSGAFVEGGAVAVDAGIAGAEGNPIFIAAGDLNGDGLDDVAVSRLRDRKVTLLFNSGGQFSAANGVDVFAVWYPIGLAIADLDRDGDADVIVNTYNSPPGVLENFGGQSFSDAGPYGQNVSFTTVLLGPPALADFNGDGVLDLAYSNYPNTEFFVDVDVNSFQEGRYAVRTLSNSAGRDFGVAPIVSTASTEAGDYNGDATVNSLDLAVWRANFLDTAGPGLSADGNRNGDVEGGDFLFWQRRVGAAAAAASTTFSEPPVATRGPASGDDLLRFDGLWQYHGAQRPLDQPTLHKFSERRSGRSADARPTAGVPLGPLAAIDARLPYPERPATRSLNVELVAGDDSSFALALDEAFRQTFV
jgi:hypothetical protein